MSGCGNGKYLIEICWKLLIFASKALISCVFPKTVTTFCDFLENTCMYETFEPYDNLKKYKMKDNPIHFLEIIISHLNKQNK